MRKFITTLFLIIGITISTNAVLQGPKLLHSSNFNLIPSATSEGKTGFYFINSESDSPTATFTIYDEEIQLVKEFEIDRPIYNDIQHSHGDIINDRHYCDIPRIGVIPERGGDDGWYEITSGIFSNDYNYILPITSVISYNDSDVWGTVTCITGYQVYDLDNLPVLTISLPSGWGTDLGDPDIWFTTLAGKKYIIIEAWDLNNMTNTQECVTLIYRLDGTSKATHVLTAPAGKISPRSPRKGETVTVEIDERFSNETCLVNVCSTDGRNLVQKTINPGETSISFSTAGFPHGVYIVNVTGKAGKIETAKIIVH